MSNTIEISRYRAVASIKKGAVVAKGLQGGPSQNFTATYPRTSPMTTIRLILNHLVHVDHMCSLANVG